MSLLRNVAVGLRSLFHKERAEGHLDEEPRGFLDMAAEEKMTNGTGLTADRNFQDGRRRRKLTRLQDWGEIRSPTVLQNRGLLP